MKFLPNNVFDYIGQFLVFCVIVDLYGQNLKLQKDGEYQWLN